MACYKELYKAVARIGDQRLLTEFIVKNVDAERARESPVQNYSSDVSDCICVRSKWMRWRWHNYTVFRQAFLLIQYSFICKQYFFCSDREYQYFFDRWLIVSTTLFWSWKLIEKFIEKMENNSTLENILLVFNRNAELLRLVGATFYSKVASLRRMMKKNFIILKSLPKRKFLLMAIICFICFVVVYIWLVKYQLKVFGTYLYAHWTYSWQCCIWNFSQYYNN